MTTAAPATSLAAIETHALGKRYGRHMALADLDLRVERGEVFGFIGPNGAGKTTTIRLLLDLIRPSAGSARVLGFDTRRDGVELRRRVGYLPGDVALLTCTVRSRRSRVGTSRRPGWCRRSCTTRSC